VGFVLMIHSLVRWLIVAVAVIAIVRFAVGWLRRDGYDRLERGLSSGYAGLMDLQVLLGLIYLLATGFSGAGFPMHRIEHLVTMLVAAVVAHLPARWKSAPGPVRHRNALLAILVSLLLDIAGVAVLPGGWAR
jgi:hypothetical protein